MSIKKIIILLFILGFITHGNTLRNQLFWDDDDNIVKNAYIKDFHYLPRLLTRNQIEGSLGQLSNQYRPLLLLSYSIEYHLWGLWPVGYHLVNVSLHIINSILVFLFIIAILRRLQLTTYNQLLALLTSLFFLLHPIQTEAVAYVAGRTDLLPTFFMLCGLILFMRHRIKKHELRIQKEDKQLFSMIHDSKFMIPLSYILALLSKETAITFPLLLFITGYFFIYQSIKKTIRKEFRLWVSLGTIAILYTFLRLTIFNFQNTLNFYGRENIFTSNILYRTFTFFYALTTYVQLLIAPIELHAERLVPIATTILNFPVFIGLLLSLASWFLIILGIRRIKNPLQDKQESSTGGRHETQDITYNSPLTTISAYGLLWFWVSIFLTSNIPVPINSLLAEHFLYTPSIGLFFITATLIVSIYRLVSKFFMRKTIIFLIPLIAIFTIYVFRSISRNREWHDPITFYEQTLRFTPTSGRVINNLAMNYADRGNHAKAILYYQKAIALADIYPQIHYNLANSFRAQGDIEEALKEYQRSLTLDHNFLPTYGKLIPLLKQMGKTIEATSIVQSLKERGLITAPQADELLHTSQP